VLDASASFAAKMSTMSDTGFPTFDSVCTRVPWCRPDVLTPLLELAIEIAREGREGRRIGTLFTLGQTEAVLAHSRPLILDPLAGHAPHATSILDPNVRGTVKELAQLDGAFVVAEDGTVRAACRYLNASVQDVDVPFGLGSRHLAAASISKRFDVVAIVVSESAVVRVFYEGTLIAEIIPELWLLRRHIQPQQHLRGFTEQHVNDLAIFTSVARDAAAADQGLSHHVEER
jgi:diadenylate cyclase